MLEPWIETYTGKRMYFLNPQPEMVDIEDIAHSLSHQCRFSGHTERFYSVAEHCVNVSWLLPYNKVVTRMQGLMHDASEAYLLDVPSPVKQYLTNYKDMEERLMRAIFTRFNVPFPLPDEVKEADAVMLKAEASALLPSKGRSWLHEFPTTYEHKSDVCGWSSRVAKEYFIEWFEYLTLAINSERNNYGSRSQEVV